MLSYDELLEQVRQLTPKERLTLIEATAQMIREDLSLQIPKVKASSVEKLDDKTGSGEYIPFIRAEWLNLDEEALRAKGIELRGTPVDTILGIGSSDQKGHSPTDEENKEDYINYLIEKYS